MLVEKKKKKKKTKSIDNEPNPVWNETFEFYVVDAIRDTLSLKLYDKDVLKPDDFLGTVEEIPIVDILTHKYENNNKNDMQNVVFNVKVEKEYAKLKNADQNPCTIILSFSYNDKKQANEK